jgi:hypothetical protein
VFVVGVVKTNFPAVKVPEPNVTISPYPPVPLANCVVGLCVLTIEPLTVKTLPVELKVKFASTETFGDVLLRVITPLSVPPVTVSDPLVPLDPDVPELPDLPEEPLEPDVPLDPDVPELPDLPEEPLEPDVPLDPDVPELPDLPEEPLEPEAPEAPDVPEEPFLPLNTHEIV